MSRTFILLHGAFHGGWCWARVAKLLRARGHAVFTPTQTGLGERRHLLTDAVSLETFIADLTGLIEAEELTDAILVGHSFGGITISGVADRMPARVRHLVYLDSRILENGQAQADVDPERAAGRREAAMAHDLGLSVPPPPTGFFGLPPGPDADWVARRMTPHPFRTMTDKLRLANQVGNGLPRTYIACTAPVYAPLEQSRRWVRGRPGWASRDIGTGHDAMVTAPEALAQMLEEIAA